MPQEAKVLYCVEFDAVTEACTQQAWLPAPSLLPPLNAVEVAVLLGATAGLLAMAWGGKMLGRTTRD